MEEQMRAKCQRQQQATTQRRQDDRATPRTTQTPPAARSKSTEDVRRVATTSTTTDDLPGAELKTTTAQMSADALKRMLRDAQTTTATTPSAHERHERPKSLSEGTPARDRSHRSLEGRRRSLERTQCVDLTCVAPRVKTCLLRGVARAGTPRRRRRATEWTTSSWNKWSRSCGVA